MYNNVYVLNLFSLFEVLRTLPHSPLKNHKGLQGTEQVSSPDSPMVKAAVPGRRNTFTPIKLRLTKYYLVSGPGPTHPPDRGLLQDSCDLTLTAGPSASSCSQGAD